MCMLAVMVSVQGHDEELLFTSDGMHGCMYLNVTTIYLCQRRYEAALAEL